MILLTSRVGNDAHRSLGGRKGGDALENGSHTEAGPKQEMVDVPRAVFSQMYIYDDNVTRAFVKSREKRGWAFVKAGLIRL